MIANTNRKRPNAESGEEANKKGIAGIAQSAILADGQQVQYIMGPTGPMILIPSSNGHLAMPAVAPFWLPQQQQQQQQQPLPMEVTVTTVANSNTPKKTQPMFVAMTTTAQTQQQQQTTIDSFNEKHRDVEEHFRRSLGLLHSSTSSSSLKDAPMQPNTDTATVTIATSTPSEPTLFMPVAQPTTTVVNAIPQFTVPNRTATVYTTQNVVTTSSEVGSQVASAEVAMPTSVKPPNVINNALNIENLIATSSTPTHSQQTIESSSQEQQQTKNTDVQVGTNPFAIYLAPGPMYQQQATTGLNYAPFISMDPSLLGGTALLLQPQLAAVQQALMQQNNAKLNEDALKMVQASSLVGMPTTGSTESGSDASNTLLTMLRAGVPAGVKPIYVVDNSDGTHQQLRSISGSNIIGVAPASMDHTGHSLSAQNSASQIVPTPMNTDDNGGQVMETAPANQSITQQRRSVHSDVSSVSESVEDHFTRALGSNWQLSQKY